MNNIKNHTKNYLLHCQKEVQNLLGNIVKVKQEMSLYLSLYSANCNHQQGKKKMIGK